MSLGQFEARVLCVEQRNIPHQPPGKIIKIELLAILGVFATDPKSLSDHHVGNFQAVKVNDVPYIFFSYEIFLQIDIKLCDGLIEFLVDSDG